MGRGIGHPLLARVYDPITEFSDRLLFSRHRAYLGRGLSGRVLDLGAGTGRMFDHVRSGDNHDRTPSLHAIEPDPHMRRRAVSRSKRLDLPVTFVDGRAEALPYRNDTFDVVLACMVFCTIADPARALDEACRVIRPGGELRVLEHVAADGWSLRFQRLARPCWSRIAGGCRPDRPTDRLLLEHPDLACTEVQRLAIGIPPARPFIRGRFAAKPSSDQHR